MPKPNLAMKVRRVQWVEAEHPRDRKGKFIETGAEVRWLAGFIGHVVRNVGGGRFEIAPSNGGSHVIVHRNYLTVTARPDGSPPTDRVDSNPLRSIAEHASPDAVDAPIPTAIHPVSATPKGESLSAALTRHGDGDMQALARQAAVDYQDALENGTPDDEADERAGLLAVLDEIDDTYPDDPRIAELTAELRETAEAEPPVDAEPEPAVPEPSIDDRFDAAIRDANAANDALSAGVLTLARQHVAESDGTVAPAVAQLVDMGTANDRDSSVALRNAVAANSPGVAKPVYNGANEGGPDGQAGTSSGSTLAEPPAGGVRDPAEPGRVLPEQGAGSPGSDRRPAPEPGRTGLPGRDGHGQDRPAASGPVNGREPSVPGDPAAPGGTPRQGVPGPDSGGRPGADTDSPRLPDEPGSDRGAPGRAGSPPAEVVRDADGNVPGDEDYRFSNIIAETEADDGLWEARRKPGSPNFARVYVNGERVGFLSRSGNGAQWTGRLGRPGDGNDDWQQNATIRSRSGPLDAILMLRNEQQRQRERDERDKPQAVPDVAPDTLAPAVGSRYDKWTPFHDDNGDVGHVYDAADGGRATIRRDPGDTGQWLLETRRADGSIQDAEVANPDVEAVMKQALETLADEPVAATAEEVTTLREAGAAAYAEGRSREPVLGGLIEREIPPDLPGAMRRAELMEAYRQGYDGAAAGARYLGTEPEAKPDVPAAPSVAAPDGTTVDVDADLADLGFDIPTPVERTVYTAGPERSYTDEPDYALLSSLTAQLVRVQFYDPENDEDADGPVEVGRIVSVDRSADGWSTVVWQPDGEPAYTLDDNTAIYSITRIAEATDPGQEPLAPTRPARLTPARPDAAPEPTTLQGAMGDLMADVASHSATPDELAAVAAAWSNLPFDTPIRVGFEDQARDAIYLRAVERDGRLTVHYRDSESGRESTFVPGPREMPRTVAARNAALGVVSAPDGEPVDVAAELAALGIADAVDDLIALAAPAAPVPMPEPDPLPDDWNEVPSGTPIRVGFEDHAHNGTLTRTRQDWQGNVTVFYKDDDGTEHSFTPTRGEKPRHAVYDPVVRSLIERFPGELDVGSWRAVPDPLNPSIVTITGTPNVTGQMRATLDGWRGQMGKPPGRRNNYGEPETPPAPTITADDPRALLDQLYNSVNGDGAADLTRAEIVAGRKIAPEVATSWDLMPIGARIRLPVGEKGADMDVVFHSFNSDRYGYLSREFPNRENIAGSVRYSKPGGDLDPAGDPVTFRLIVDNGVKPRPATPELGKGEVDPEAVEEGEGESIQPTIDPNAMPVIIAPTAPNFVPTGIDDLSPAGKMAKLDANIAALRTLKTLRSAERVNTPATPEEQAVLAKWAGWGGLPEVFDADPDRYPRFQARRREVLSLLSDVEIREGRRSTLNAHYTDARAVQAIWDTVKDLGFDHGRVLEPGSGSGTFIGFAPREADMVGVELDSTTAAISQYLYPRAMIRNESFAATNIPDSSVDLTVGNVPYGRLALIDRQHNSRRHSIHNHFILKSMALTRPGGLVAVLTSRYTLDSMDAEARQEMFGHADLVGAVRLPNGSHHRAAETDVIEDLLIFRVRQAGEEPQKNDGWLTSAPQALDGWELSVNNYFIEHPENVLGTMGGRNGQHGGEVMVTGDKDMPGLAAALAGIVADAKRDGLTATPSPERTDTLERVGSTRYDGHIQVEDDGTFTQVLSGASSVFPVVKKHQPEVVALCELRDAFHAVLDAEQATREETEAMTDARAVLNERYDAYVLAYGPVSRITRSKSGSRLRPPAINIFKDDPHYDWLRGLETYFPPTEDDPEGSPGSAAKAGIFRKRQLSPREIRTTADNAPDALTLCADTFGEIRLEEVARIMGISEDEARHEIGNLAFEIPDLTDEEKANAEAAYYALEDDPDAPQLADLDIVSEESAAKPGQWVSRSEYLFGDVRKKIAHSRAAAQKDIRFAHHAEQLSPTIPAELGPDSIQVRIGAAWIPASDIEAFMCHLLGLPRGSRQVKVVASGNGVWRVKGPINDTSTGEWGVPKRATHRLIQAMLEQRGVKITSKDKIDDYDETEAAQQMVKKIAAEFESWIWQDTRRGARLQNAYNRQYNNLTLREWDGQERQFPGMSEIWQRKVLPHVKDAAVRVIDSPTTLLAHVVGAGKTATMVMSAMEMRRLGLVKKPAIIVPDHLLDQFSREFLEIYPNAKLLRAGKGMTAKDRREFVARAGAGDWDAVIMTQGAFEAIPMSPAHMQEYIDNEMASMYEQLAEVKANTDPNDKTVQKTVKQMELQIAAAEEALKKRLLDSKKDQSISFEQTGIDYLFVDESHEYSNLRTLSVIETASASGANKATDLHMKMQYLRSVNKNGRIATFATGTPIRNTVTQAYINVKYLRPDLLVAAGIKSFDQWAATFAAVVEDTEVNVSGVGFRSKSRFSTYRNVPEFLRMFHTFADVKLAEDLNLPTPNLITGRVQIVPVQRTERQAAYIEDIGVRCLAISGGGVDPHDDNMLKISGDGRKAALSMSLLIDPSTITEDNPDGDPYPHEDGKIEAAADRIAAIYQRDKDKIYVNPDSITEDDPEGEADDLPGSLQIVFLDMGVPKKYKKKKKAEDDGGGGEHGMDEAATDFNAYQTLRDNLIAQGVPADEIRFMQDAKTDELKAELFQAARSGKVSVIIGSSASMAQGTNMQKRAVALHHIDAPWRPSDVAQRDGRIQRQGNWNMDTGIEIIRYVTEETFDTYMWQTLERKAKFIHQIMKGDLDVREIEDIGDTAADYGVTMAVSMGNPDYLDKAVADRRLIELQSAQRSHVSSQQAVRFALGNRRAKIPQNDQTIVAYQALAERSLAWLTANPDQQLTTITAEDGSTTEVLVERPFAIHVGDQDFDSRPDAGVKLRELLMAVGNSDSYRYGADKQQATVIGQLRGMNITASNSSVTSMGERLISLSIEGYPNAVANLAPSQVRDSTGSGLVTRLENALNAIPNRLNDAVLAADDNKRAIEGLEKRFGDFPGAAELTAIQARASRIAEKIARADRRRAGARVPFDPNIDTDQNDAEMVRGGNVDLIYSSLTGPTVVDVSVQTLALGDLIVVTTNSGATHIGKVTELDEHDGFVFVTTQAGDEKVTVKPFDLDAVVEKIHEPTGGAVPVNEAAVLAGRVPERQSTPVEDLSPGDMIEMQIEDGLTTGEVVSAELVNGLWMVTIRPDDGGELVVHAYSPGTGLDKLNRVALTEIPGAKSLAVIDGAVTVVEVKHVLSVVNGAVVVETKKMRAEFREALHPRDREGRFIEIGAEVRIWGGGLGKIMGVAGGGRVNVHRSDGVDVIVDAGNVTIIKSPAGDLVTARTPAAPKVPNVPAAAPLPAHVPASSHGTVDAPDATPDNASAEFNGPDGARAWLVAGQDGEAHAYMQSDPDDPATIVKFNDPEDWAKLVDAAGMAPVDDARHVDGATQRSTGPVSTTDAPDAADPRSMSNEDLHAEFTAQNLDGVTHPSDERFTDRQQAVVDEHYRREAENTDPATQDPNTFWAQFAAEDEHTAGRRQLRDAASDDANAAIPSNLTISGRQGTGVHSQLSLTAVDGDEYVIVPHYDKNGKESFRINHRTKRDMTGSSFIGDADTEEDAIKKLSRYVGARHPIQSAGAKLERGRSERDAAAVDLPGDAANVPSPLGPATTPKNVEDLPALGEEVRALTSPNNAEANKHIVYAASLLKDGKLAEAHDALSYYRSIILDEAEKSPGSRTPALQAILKDKPAVDRAFQLVQDARAHGFGWGEHNQQNTPRVAPPAPAAPDAPDDLVPPAAFRAPDPTPRTPPPNADPETAAAIRALTNPESDYANAQIVAASFLVRDGRHEEARKALYRYHRDVLGSAASSPNPDDPAVASILKEKPKIEQAMVLIDDALAARANVPDGPDGSTMPFDEVQRMTAGDGPSIDTNPDEAALAAFRAGARPDGSTLSFDEVQAIAAGTNLPGGQDIAGRPNTPGAVDSLNAPDSQLNRSAVALGAERGKYTTVEAMIEANRPLTAEQEQTLREWAAHAGPGAFTDPTRTQVPSTVALSADGEALSTLAGGDTELATNAAAYDAAVASGDKPNMLYAHNALARSLSKYNSEDTPDAQADVAHRMRDTLVANIEAYVPPIDEKHLEGILGTSGGKADANGPGSARRFLVKGVDGQYRFTPERLEVHQRIMDNLLNSGATPQANPHFNVMGGGPAAGKSSMEAEVPEIGNNAVMLNADDIKAALPEYDEMVRAGDANAANFTHEESSYLTKMIQQEAFRRRLNVALDGTGDSSPESLRKKIGQARANGYEVNGYYVTAPADVAWERAQKRSERTGRVVPESVVRGVHKSVSQTLPEVMDEFDTLQVYDTTNSTKSTDTVPGIPPALIARKGWGGNTMILDPAAWQTFLDKGAA